MSFKILLNTSSSLKFPSHPSIISILYPLFLKTAVKYDKISYLEVLEKDLKVMDSTATALCRDNNIPLLVFGIADPENIVRAVKGEAIGTLVK